MATDTEVRLNVKGVDATKQAFATAAMRMAQFAARARVVGLRIAAGLSRTIGQALSLRTWRNAALGVAAAFAGPLAAVQQSAKALSELGDRAAQAGTSAEHLQRLTTALGIVGAKNANIESVTDALARMTKATGRVGEAGFRETLEEISRLGSEEERVKALADTFGRSFGPGLAAIVRQGPDALRSGFDEVVAHMPAVSESIVQQADAIADGFDLAKKGLVATWQENWTAMYNTVAEKLGMSQTELAAVFGAELQVCLVKAFDYVQTWASNFVKIFNNFPKVWKIVFVDYLGGLLAEGLLKAGAKVREWGEKIVIRFRQVADLIKAIFTDDTVEAANERAAAAIKASTDRFEKEYASITESFADNTLGKMVEELEKMGIKFELSPEAQKKIDELRENAVAAAKAVDEQREKASETVVDSVAKTAETVASKISREFKDATAVASTSYQALKIARGRGLAALPGERGESTAATAREVAKNARNTQSILAALRDLLSVERDGWTGFGKLANSFEVV